MKRGKQIFRILFSRKRILYLVFLALVGFIGCEKEYFPQAPGPKIPKETSTLEASFTTVKPLSITDKHWKESDFFKVKVSDVSTGLLYTDGLLNMTGTYNGTVQFNGGVDPGVIMKAAYDDSKLYVLVEWTDSDVDASFATSLLDGPADPLKSDDPTGWTSQGNSDRLSLAFDIGGATGAAGTFTEKGCAASCHSNEMKPLSGKLDLWNWTLATSDALGYALDMVSDSSKGLTVDSGQSIMTRNKVAVGDDRSAPAYEWDGTDQTLIRPDGKSTILDPSYFLYNKTPFLGNIVNGKELYLTAGNCAYCHGAKGEGGGPGGDGPAFNDVSFIRKYSRASFKNFAGDAAHEGSSGFNNLNSAQQDDLIAFVKGLAGVQGYYLETPDGSNADIWSVSNVVRNRIAPSPHTVYKVLFIRNLSTGNGDDEQFSPAAGKTYSFGIALMDKDGKNHIGSLKEILTFKAK